MRTLLNKPDNTDKKNLEYTRLEHRHILRPLDFDFYHSFILFGSALKLFLNLNMNSFHTKGLVSSPGLGLMGLW